MKGFAIVGIIFAVASCFAGVEGEEDKKGCMMKCDGHDMHNVEKEKGQDKEYLAGMKTCLDKYAPLEKALAADAPESEVKEALMGQFRAAAKVTCFLACKAKIEKVINADESYSQEGADAMVGRVYPTTELQDKIKAGWKKCVEGKTFSMDNKCESYKEPMVCMKNVHFDVCKVDEKFRKEMEM